MPAAAREILQQAVQSHKSGRFADAELLCRDALKNYPNHLDALNLLSEWARNSGRLESAIDWAARAAAAHPKIPEGHLRMGDLLHQAGRLPESIAALQRAIALNPSEPAFHARLGLVFADNRQFELSVSEHKRTTELKPDDAMAHANLGAMLRQLGRLDEALPAVRTALALDPRLVAAHHNLGVIFSDQGKYGDAIAAYSNAIEIDSNDWQLHNARAQAYLITGDMERGWEELEWRSEIARQPNPKRWKGEAINGRTILLFAEGGFGDAIQFARYVPMVADLGATVILACREKLIRLFQQLPGISQVVPLGQRPPPFDLFCPTISLPLAFGHKLQDIPAPMPYLKAHHSWLGAKPTGAGVPLRVGLARAGNPALWDDFKRLVPARELAPLLETKGVKFYSLRKRPQAKRANESASETGLIDLTAELDDFYDTAALIESLDLVISSDTAVAHLAGAMGKPVWILLSYAPDWRWLLARDDSPWYPSARLFRQETIGDWSQVVRRVAHSRRELVNVREKRIGARI